MLDIKMLLRLAIEREASDLHLAVDLPPVLRIHGELMLLDEFEKLAPVSIKELVSNTLNPEHKEKFEKKQDFDYSFFLPGIGRFRVNIYMAQQNFGASFRVILPKIKSIDELGLPQIVKQFCLRKSGLVIVTGPTGSGKSTSLAAIIDLINQQRNCRIIIIEDPVEYLHEHKKSMVIQREVHADTSSFPLALRQTLRQDPNVICVGEMRDLETISTVLTAAETGHLVFSTLHTPDTVESINRIIDVFPPHQQDQIRIQLSVCLDAVIAQKLLPRKDKQGRVIATEVLIATHAVRHLIREKRIDQIANFIETSPSSGMHTMDASILELYDKGLIGKEMALSEIKEKRNRERLEASD